MGAMKAFAEEISVQMGFGGELNDEVLEEAQRRLTESVKCDSNPNTPEQTSE